MRFRLWSDNEAFKAVCVGRNSFRVKGFALLALGLAAPFVPHVQAYQVVQESFTVRVEGPDGQPIPDVEVDLMGDGRSIARMKTDADGRVSIQGKRGVLTLSIRQAGYAPVEEVIHTEPMSRSVFDIKLAPLPKAQETVTVQATNEEFKEQTSSPGESIKPSEANESPSRPLTLTDALPLVPGVVFAPNGQTQIEGAGEMHSALLVNSVDTVDPATGRFGLSVPIDVVDSLHVFTSPYLAQYGRFTAGVVTAETKPGGSKWHYDLNEPLPEFRIRSGHLTRVEVSHPQGVLWRTACSGSRLFLRRLRVCR